MRRTQLRAFDAVARLGGFSRAAARLGLTQPAVTIQVRSLEEQYGLKLFERRGGRVTMTRSGRDLFERTQVLFAAEDRVREYLDQSEGLLSGDIRIASDSPHLAMPVIARFQNSHPGVRPLVTLGNTPAVWRQLLEKDADLAFVSNPPRDKRVHIQGLGNRGLRVLVPADHDLAEDPSVALERLSHFSCVFREAQSNTQKSLRRALRKAGVSLKPAIELTSREAVLEAVFSGLGIGFVFAGEAAGDGRVREVAIDGLEEECRDALACLKSQRYRRSVEAFLGEAKACKSSTVSARRAAGMTADPG